jgi:4-diphosphocytidyl-2-C-methyl-D-erythritol kinase
MRSKASCSRAFQTATISDPMQADPGPIEARAKINLYLHVTGRRDDGLHELDSLFVRAAIADRLWLAHADADSLEVSGPFAGALADENAEDNLVMRAVDVVRRKTNHRGAFRVHLEKNLPVASGMGGGSADAAAMLKAVARLIGGPEDLESVARTLGADVPPCLSEHPILVSGVGEIIRAAPQLPLAAMVLVNPGRPLSTPQVFGERSGDFSAPEPLDTSLAGFDDLVRELARHSNDLEEPACRLEPRIVDVLDALRGQRDIGLARMSGSGATCFGLAATLRQAQAVAARLRDMHPDWWVVATEMVTGAASLGNDKPIKGHS